MSGKSRLRRQAEQAGLTTLHIPKKISGESTVSEISDHFHSGTPILSHSPRSPKSPDSPIFSLENLHDIEELLDEGSLAKEITPDVQDKYYKFEVPKKKEKNVFNFEPESAKPLSNPEIKIETNEEVVVTDDDVDEELIEYEYSDRSVDSRKSAISEKPKEDLKIVEKVPTPPKVEPKPTPSKVQEPEDSSETSTLKSLKKSSKKHKSKSKSCYYCENVCDFHLKQLKPDKEESERKAKKKHKKKKKKRETKDVANEAVQAGAPNAKYGYGHYLFDPSKVSFKGIFYR